MKQLVMARYSGFEGIQGRRGCRSGVLFESMRMLGGVSSNKDTWEGGVPLVPYNSDACGCGISHAKLRFGCTVLVTSPLTIWFQIEHLLRGQDRLEELSTSDAGWLSFSCLCILWNFQRPASSLHSTVISLSAILTSSWNWASSKYHVSHQNHN